MQRIFHFILAAALVLVAYMPTAQAGTWDPAHTDTYCLIAYDVAPDLALAPDRSPGPVAVDSGSGSGAIAPERFVHGINVTGKPGYLYRAGPWLLMRPC